MVFYFYAYDNLKRLHGFIRIGNNPWNNGMKVHMSDPIKKQHPQHTFRQRAAVFINA